VAELNLAGVDQASRSCANIPSKIGAGTQVDLRCSRRARGDADQAHQQCAGMDADAAV